MPTFAINVTDSYNHMSFPLKRDGGSLSFEMSVRSTSHSKSDKWAKEISFLRSKRTSGGIYL